MSQTETPTSTLSQERRERYLTALLEVQRQLLVARTVEDYMGILQILGEVSSASRVYIYESEFAPDCLRVSQRAEWCAAGIKSEIENPLFQYQVVNETMPHWVQPMLNGETIASLTADLPEPERQLCELIDIQAIVIAPIVAEGELLGFIGLDNCVEARLWQPDEIELLQSAATAIVLWHDRKRTEEALRQSEAKYRRIFENSQVGICRTRLEDGLFLEANQRLVTMLGYASAADVVGKRKASDFYVDPQQRQQAVELLQGDRVDFETQFYRQDGSIFWGLCSLCLNSEENCFEGIILDITERKRSEVERERAEAALQASEAELLAIFNAMQDVVVVLNAEGRYLKIASTNAPALYKPVSELLGKTVEEVLPTASADLFLNQIRWTLESGQTTTLEYSLPIEGREIWFDATISPFQAGTVIWVARDITKRKTAEAALRQKEAQYRSIFESVSDGIMVIDLETAELITANPAFARMHGYPPQAFSEVNSGRFIHADYRDSTEFISTVRAGEPFFTQAVNIRQDGTSFDVEVTGIPYQHEGKACVLAVVRDISDRQRAEAERKQAEIALQRSERRFKTLVNNIPGVVYHYSSYDQSMDFVSEAVQEIYGFPAIEYVGNRVRRLSDSCHPDDIARVDQEIKLALAAKRPYAVEYRLIRCDGEIRWVYERGQALYDSNDKVLGLDGVIFDVSDRKRIEHERQLAETALQKSEALFRAIFENAGISIGITRTDGTSIANNPASCQILGYTEAEYQMLPFTEFTHPDDLEADLNLYQELLAGLRDSYRIEKRYIRKDGQVIWASLIVSAVRDSQGNVQFTMAMAEDITEQKRSQATLLERARLAALTADIGIALTQGNTLQDMLDRCAKALFQHLDVVFARIWTLNESEQILELQASAGQYTQLTGRHSRIKVGELKIGQIAQERQSCLTNDVLNDPRIHDKAWATREGVVAFAGYPLIVEDRVVGVMAVFARHQLPENTLQEMASIANEIALGIEHKHSEEALKKAVAAAEVANRAKSQFLSNMSHELRTPLNVILGFTQLLDRSNFLNPQQQGYLETINRSGEHLLALINDVLEMSKIEAGRITLNEEDCDLISLLNSLEEMLRLKAESKRLQLVFDLALNLPCTIRIDEAKLRQVLMNLLGNAIKFTQAGSVTLRVKIQEIERLKSDRSPLTLYFEIEDTGVGIASEELKHLFEPFVQTTAGRNSQEGTGLGLSISRKFVNLMGGEITATSELEVGSIFKFTVRTQAVADSQKFVRSLGQQAIGLEPGQPIYRILIAEDKRENRQLLVELLSPIGFEIREAMNGQEAIELWQTWQPHLILMDIRMPVMDGYQATQHIKAANGQTIVIALTGSAFEEDRMTALSIGCDDFVRKPVRTETILAKLTGHLNVRYLYANRQGRSSLFVKNNIATANSLTASDLAIMPSDWVHELHQAATRVNAKQINSLIAEIPSEAANLAIALTSLVNDFRFDEIVNLTDKH